MFRKQKYSLFRDILMKKFSKVVQVFVETMDGSSPSLTQYPMADLSWLLIQIVTWWGDFGQIGTGGSRSYPSHRHGKEISVIA